MANKSNKNKDYKRTRNYLRSIGYPQKVADQIIKAYGADAGLVVTDVNVIAETVQSNWSAFLAFYGKVKKQYVGLRVREEDYEYKTVGNTGLSAGDLRDALYNSDGGY